MIQKFLAKEIQELQKLLTKKNQTEWSEKHTAIFKRLKDICSDLPNFLMKIILIMILMKKSYLK